MESLPAFLETKRRLAKTYQQWGEAHGIRFITEQENGRANYWLNTLQLEDQEQRDAMLKYTNENKIMTRSAWIPMHRLKPYSHCIKSELPNTDWLFQRLVNVPSGITTNG